MLPVPAVQRADERVDDLQIVQRGLLVLAQGHQCLLPVEVEQYVERAGERRQAEQRQLHVRIQKGLRGAPGQGPGLVLLQVRHLQRAHRRGEVIGVPLARLEKHIRAQDAVDEMHAVDGILHALRREPVGCAFRLLCEQLKARLHPALRLGIGHFVIRGAGHGAQQRIDIAVVVVIWPAVKQICHAQEPFVPPRDPAGRRSICRERFWTA